MPLTGREQASDLFMNILRIPKGPLMSNMFLAYIGNEIFVIDPSVSPDALDYDIPALSGILITHGHYDHIKYVDEWHAKFPKAPVYMHPDDDVLLRDAGANCSYMDGIAKTFDFYHEDPQATLNFGSVEVRVIHTPGHTKGSVCYMFTEGDDKYMFTGDTVFAGSVGRTDMIGGSYEALMGSIEKISRLPSDTRIYPGHGLDSTIGDEIKSNPFFAM